MPVRPSEVQSVVVMGYLIVMVASRVLAGIDVHCDTSEARHRVKELVAATLRDIVSFLKVPFAVRYHIGLRPKLMADPADPDAPHILDSFSLAEGTLGTVDELRIDRVHQPVVDLSGRIPEHEQDQDGDRDSHDRVGQRKAKRHAYRSEDDA